MKRIFSVIMVLCIVLSLSACGLDLGIGSSKGPKFKLNEDEQSYTLVSYTAGREKDVVVPDTYEGLPVTVIGGRAFEGQTSIESIVIPEGVTDIGVFAFTDCTGLDSVVLPSTLIEIGSGAFNNCSSLNNVVVPDGIHKIDDGVFFACSSLENITLPANLEEIGWQAFNFCEKLNEIIIPETVTAVGEAFLECTALTEIRIPDSVTSLAAHAFTGCSSLERIYLGANVTLVVNFGSFHTSTNGTEFHNEPFALCQSLQYIEVSDDNPNYQSINGNLFSKDGTELIRYAVGKSDASYTVPDSVTTICEGAFTACSNWENAVLKSITVPASVTYIGQSVFIGCSALENIYFGGTMEQWDNAKKDTTGTSFVIDMDGETITRNDIIGDYGNYTIKCTDGQVAGNTISDDKEK